MRSNRQKTAKLFVALAGAAFVRPAVGAVRTFTNGSGDFSFTNPNNYDTGAPGPGDTALFSSTTTGVIGTVKLNGATPTIDTLSFTHGSGTYIIGSAVGDGTITLNTLSKINGGNLTINSNLTALGTTLTANLSNQVTTISGLITATNFTKGGDNNLTLTNTANSITGTILINSGILQANAAGTLGTAGITLAGGSLNLRNAANAVYANAVTVTGNAQINGTTTGVTDTLGALSLGSQQLTLSSNSNDTVIFSGTTLTGNPTLGVGASGNFNLGALNDGGVARTITYSGAGGGTNGGFILNTAAASLAAGGVINETNNGIITLSGVGAWNSNINVTSGLLNYNAANALTGPGTITANGASTGNNTVGQVSVNSAITSFGDDQIAINAGDVLQVNSTAATGLTRGTNLTLAKGAIISETAANQLTTGTPIANLGTNNDLLLGLSNGIAQNVTVGNSGGTTPFMGISTDGLSDRNLSSGSVITAAGATGFTLQGINNRQLTVATGVTFVSAGASTGNLIGRVSLSDNTANAYGGNVTLEARSGTATSAASSVNLAVSNALNGVVALNVDGATAAGSTGTITVATGGALNAPVNLLSGSAANLSGGVASLTNAAVFSTTTQAGVTVNPGAALSVTNATAINNGPGASANEVVLATDNTAPYRGPILVINTAGLTGTGQIARTGSGAVIYQLSQSGALPLTGQVTPSSILAGDVVRMSANNITNLSAASPAAVYEVINDRTQDLALNGGILTTDAGNQYTANTTTGFTLGSSGGTIAAPSGLTFRIASAVTGGTNPLTLGVNAVIDPVQQNSTTKIKDGTVRFNGAVTAGNTVLSVGSVLFTTGNTLTSYTSNSTGTTYADNGATGSATGTGTTIFNAGMLATGGGGAAVGTISGPVMAGTGANTFAPGDIGGIGTLNLTASGASLTLDATSTLNFDVNGFSLTSDLLALTGTLNIAGGTPSINLQTAGTLDGTTTYTLATYATSSVNNSSFAFGSAPPAGYQFVVSPTSIQLAPAVPEPATVSLMAIGAVTLLRRRREQ